MCWSGATGRCTTKGAPQNNKTSIKFTARGQKAPGGVFMVEYGGGGLLQRHKLHGSPRRRSFYSCASSRALLHVGSLSLWDRQPSNAPPLLLSPAGLASRRGPHTKTHLGLRPKPPLTLKLRLDTNDALASSIQRRRYALKVPAAHFMWGSAETKLK